MLVSASVGVVVEVGGGGFDVVLDVVLVGRVEVVNVDEGDGVGFEEGRGGGCEVGRAVCDDVRGIVGCDVGRDVRDWSVGLCVFDVGLGSDLDVESMGSRDLSVGVGREVGLDVSVSLVARRLWVTML